MPICPGIAGCSSIFILTSFTLPLAAFTAFSRMGVSCLQGPHHGAQKSTSTGWARDSSITSFMKVCVVVSLTTSAAAVAPPFCSICPRRNYGFRPIKWSSGVRMQSASGVGRGAAGNALDARDMPGPFEKADEIVARDRGGHGVDQRMIVERRVLEHGRVEDDRDAPL